MHHVPSGIVPRRQPTPALHVDLRSALALEADRTVRCTRTEDHQEAVSAFMQKRKPSFNGR